MTQYSINDSKEAMTVEEAPFSEVGARCAALAGFGGNEGKIDRALGDTSLEEAMEMTADWMSAAGLSCRRDEFGNLMGRTPAGSDTPVLLLGSHLDTVPDGGRFDGALGVLVATALVERLPADLPFAVEVVAFADEEGRFGKGCLGSRAYAGELTDADLELTRADGLTLAECLRRIGRDPSKAVGRREMPHDLLGYCEVHLGQDTSLEKLGVPLGTLDRILGKSRARVQLTGAATHAAHGLNLRHDASCGMAELILAAEHLMREDDSLRSTIGEVRVHPQAVNVVAGKASASLDLRHPEDSVRKGTLRCLKLRAKEIADERGLGLSWTTVEESDTAVADPTLSATLNAAARHAGDEPPSLVSFAGHDAAVVAAHAPVAMLFVRSRDGITHHPDEFVADADIDVALTALAGFVTRLGEAMSNER